MSIGPATRRKSAEAVSRVGGASFVLEDAVVVDDDLSTIAYNREK
jgi:hypothetical protein